MKKIIQVVTIACLIFPLLGAAAESLDEGMDIQRAVLVTGASTGIGRKIAEVLAEQGHFVYAGARKQADLDALDAIDNIQAIRLDVTIQEDIDAAVKTVREGGRGLHGLVNNAGVFIGGPMIDVDLEEVKWLMDVNVYGVYRVTQAFAPMIIESEGRISTIGSISGTLSGRFSGPYSMSKHAIEAYTDSLAAEMAPLGVHVSVIEPGNYDSKIGETAQARLLAKKDQYAKTGSPFAERFEAWIDRSWSRSQYKDPGEVADAALHALFADEPYRRYMVVPNETEAAWTIGKQIEELVQLNEYQAYSYSREELIDKIDAATHGDAEILTGMLHEFLANSGTAAAHERFWSDDLIYTSSSGTRTNKAEILASMTGSADSDDGEPGPVYTAEDIQLDLNGSMAVIAFKLVGTPPDDSPVMYYFNTGTFLKRDGEWRAVAWQATKIPPAEGET